MRTLIFAILAMLVTPNAQAVGARTEKTVAWQAVAVPLDGSQSARTSTAVAVMNHSVLRLRYVYTWDSGTAFEIHCESSDNGTSGFAHIDVPDSSGTLGKDEPLYDYTVISASRTFDVRIGVGAFNYIRCYATVAGAVTADTITSTYTLYE